jgi:hypothetical protein
MRSSKNTIDGNMLQVASVISQSRGVLGLVDNPKTSWSVLRENMNSTSNNRRCFAVFHLTLYRTRLGSDYFTLFLKRCRNVVYNLLRSSQNSFIYLCLTFLPSFTISCHSARCEKEFF